MPVNERALELMAGLVIDDGRRWGDAATAWQWADAEAFFDSDGPRRHWLERPRGGSKTTDVGALCAVALCRDLPPYAKAYAVAADKDQARLLLDALQGLRQRSSTLKAELEVNAWRARSRTTGATLDVLPADAAGSWGLLPDLLVLDEFNQWPGTDGVREFHHALTTSLGKKPNARAVVISTAGDPASFQWAEREHVATSPLWRLVSIPGPLAWTDAVHLAEEKRRLPASLFERLYLNKWREGEDRLTTIDDLRACVGDRDESRLPRGLRWRYGVGLDVGTVKDRTALVVAHAETSYRASSAGRSEVEVERVVVDYVRVWAGSRERPVDLSEVEAAVLEIERSYQPRRIYFDPHQAVLMAQRLRTRNVRVREFTPTSTSISQLAMTLHRLLRDHAISLPNDPELIEELSMTRFVERVHGMPRLDHDAGRHDDRAFALGLAILAAQETTSLEVPGQIVGFFGGGTREQRRKAGLPPLKTRGRVWQ